MADPKNYQQVIPAGNDANNFRISAVPGYSYSTIEVSGGNQTIKSAPGVLGSLTVNVALTSAFAVYDGVTSAGTKVVQLPAAAAAGNHYIYGVKLGTGLTISCGAAADRVTVMYI